MSAIRGRVQVRWFSPLSNGGGITGYVITRQGGGADVVVSTPGTSDALGYLSWLDTNVEAGGTYTYTIGALSVGGASPTVSQTVTVPTSEVVVSGDHGLYGLSDDGVAVPIITDPTADFVSPEISPDGRQLVFARGIASGQHDLWVMPITGGTPRRLTSASCDDVEPAWSLDGRSIAYTSISGNNAGISVVPAAGGQSVKVANSASNPTWLGGDGTLVAVDNSVSDGPLVMLHNGARSVIPGTEGAIEPAASRDGQWLAFSYWRSDIGQHTLVVISARDGHGVETSSPVLDFQNPSWLPDGSGLLFDIREQNGVSKPAVGRFVSTTPQITDLVYLTDAAGHFDPVYAGTAPTSPRMQRWGGPTTGLRHKGSFGTVHTKVAARRW